MYQDLAIKPWPSCSSTRSKAAVGEGTAIKRRLQELLDLEKPIQAEMPSTESGNLRGVKNLFEGRHGLSSSHASRQP
jgi:hypothetical protein